MRYSQNDFIFRVLHFKANVIGQHCYKMYTYSYIYTLRPIMQNLCSSSLTIN